MGKFFAALIILLVLTIAAEGGYFIGRRSVNTAPAWRAPAIQIPQTPIPTPTPISPLEEFLFPPKLLSVLPSIEKTNITESELSLGIAGTLVDLQENSVSLALNGGNHVFNLPPSMRKGYGEWNETLKKWRSMSADELKNGEAVTVYLSYDTFSGNMTTMQIVRNIR